MLWLSHLGQCHMHCPLSKAGWSGPAIWAIFIGAAIACSTRAVNGELLTALTSGSSGRILQSSMEGCNLCHDAEGPKRLFMWHKYHKALSDCLPATPQKAVIIRMHRSVVSPIKVAQIMQQAFGMTLAASMHWANGTTPSRQSPGHMASDSCRDQKTLSAQLSAATVQKDCIL